MNTRKELIRQYKETRPEMGVYCVRNSINGKVLVAAHRDIRSRLNRHMAELRLRTEQNRALLNDYLEFGVDAFVFETLEALEPMDDVGYEPTADLKVLEQIWLEKLQPFGEKGYNRPPRANQSNA